MIGLASALTLLLAAQDPTPVAASPTAHPCDPTDNACQARMFIAKSARATPTMRARYLFVAHRSYMALFAKTGEARHLCEARANLERSLAVSGQDAQQRATFERARAGLEALEQTHDASCSAPRKRKAQPVKVAQVPAPALPAPEPPAEPPPTDPPADTAEVTDPVSSPPAIPPPRVIASNPATRPEPARVTQRSSRSGRPLVIAGGTTLGLGVMLSGLAGFAGVQVAATSDMAFDQYEYVHGIGDEDVKATQDRMRGIYNRWKTITVSTAIAGGSAIIVGAILMRLGIRKMRDPSSVALAPVPGGLVLHARF